MDKRIAVSSQCPSTIQVYSMALTIRTHQLSTRTTINAALCQTSKRPRSVKTRNSKCLRVRYWLSVTQQLSHIVKPSQLKKMHQDQVKAAFPTTTLIHATMCTPSHKTASQKLSMVRMPLCFTTPTRIWIWISSSNPNKLIINKWANNTIGDETIKSLNSSECFHLRFVRPKLSLGKRREQRAVEGRKLALWPNNYLSHNCNRKQWS